MANILPAEPLAGPMPRRVRAAIELAGCSAAVGRAQGLLQRAAVLDTGVLIVAERGVEVESVVRDLHSMGRSPAAPLITVGCADTAQAI